jgi:hypothetical protein
MSIVTGLEHVANAQGEELNIGCSSLVLNGCGHKYEQTRAHRDDYLGGKGFQVLKA